MPDKNLNNGFSDIINYKDKIKEFLKNEFSCQGFTNYDTINS